MTTAGPLIVVEAPEGDSRIVVFDSDAATADAAIEALRDRLDHVIPGAKNKLQAGMAKLMSDPARAKVHGAQTKREH